jgi:hypothetical protein
VSRPVLEAIQSPVQWLVWALSPGVNWLEREAAHSPPPGAEVKNK